VRDLNRYRKETGKGQAAGALVEAA
jgi:hypothetical protein